MSSPQIPLTFLITTVISILIAGITIIGALYHVTRDIRTNFKGKVGVDTCKILHKGVDEKFTSMENLMKAEFRVVKTLITTKHEDD